MKCNHCGVDVRLRSEFCPNCGQRIVMTMDDIISTSHDDLSRRQGESLNGMLRAGIVILLLLLSVAIGFIVLFDKKLRFDGSALPGISANTPMASGTSNDSIEKPYVDPQPLPPLPAPSLRVMGYRRGQLREQLREANGMGNRQIDGAINNGLNFLKGVQEKDGGWPVAMIPSTFAPGTRDVKWGRVGLSSLVLLSYLGNGHTWMKDLDIQRSVYAETVRRGVHFIIASQDPTTGRFGDTKGDFMYNHGMTTLAVCEAAALSGDIDLKERAAKGIEYILKTQTSRGGWDYFGNASSDSDNISVSAWQVQALYAAREAGIPVPNEAFDKALSFYSLLTKEGRGVYNFKQDDGQDLASRAGMVLMMRQMLGDGPINPDVRQLSTKLVSAVPKVKAEWGRGWGGRSKDSDERAKFNPYMLFFCSNGMFFLGSHDWDDWNVKATKAILDMQDIDGAWRANDVYSLQGGACYSTTLCILALETPNRIVHAVTTRTPSKSKDE